MTGENKNRILFFMMDDRLLGKTKVKNRNLKTYYRASDQAGVSMDLDNICIFFIFLSHSKNNALILLMKFN